METMISVLRITHIAAGALALVAGVIPLVGSKGNRTHRRWGKVYMGAMGIVLLTALLLSLFKSIPFLLLVAVFSSYLLLSGYRSLRTRVPSAQIGLPDLLLVGTGIAGGCLMAGYGVYTIARGNSFGVVALVFGTICTLLASLDIKRLRTRHPVKLAWLHAHLSRMTGAYISTVTAFLVVNVQFLPGWLVWLLPTAVGTVFIFRWIRIYDHKRRHNSEGSVDISAHYEAEKYKANA